MWHDFNIDILHNKNKTLKLEHETTQDLIQHTI
jgi:hypothetical protein